MIPLFVAVAILLVISIIFFITFPFIKRNALKKNFVRLYGRGVFKIANMYDYYLINQLVLKSNDDSKLYIDHLMFANKFIFVIKDYCFDGMVKGKEIDQSWVYYFGSEKHPKQEYINNPFIENEARVKKLSMITGLEDNMLISVILVNDDCDLSLELNESNDHFIVKRSGLKKLVEEIEARNIGELENIALSHVVKDIAELNLNKR